MSDLPLRAAYFFITNIQKFVFFPFLFFLTSLVKLDRDEVESSVTYTDRLIDIDRHG